MRPAGTSRARPAVALLLLAVTAACGDSPAAPGPLDSPGRIDAGLALRLDSLAGVAMRNAAENGDAVNRADMMNTIVTIVAMGATPTVAVLQVDGRPRTYLVAAIRDEQRRMDGGVNWVNLIAAWRGDAVDEAFLVSVFGGPDGGPATTVIWLLPPGNSFAQSPSQASETIHALEQATTPCTVVAVPNTPIPVERPCNEATVRLSAAQRFSKEVEFQRDARVEWRDVTVPMVVLK